MEDAGSGSSPSLGASPDNWNPVPTTTTTTTSTNNTVPSMAASSDNTIGQEGRSLPTPPRRLAARPSRGPLFPSGHPRSISLPQALSSFTLSNRSGTAKAPRTESHSNQHSAEPGQPQTSSTSSPGAQFSNRPAASSRHGENTTESHPSVALNTNGSSDGFVPPDIDTSTLSAPDTPLDAPQTNFYTQTSSSMEIEKPTSPVKRTVSEGNSSVFTIRHCGGPRPIGRSETTPRIAEALHTGETQLLDPLPQASDVQSQYHNSQHQDSLQDQLLQVDYAGTAAVAAAAAAAAVSEPFVGVVDGQKLQATQRALSNTDILWHIFDALDSMTIIPHELVQQRRKPLSLRHAQLIFGDNKRAVEAWEKSQPTTTADLPGAGLFNCLFVNSLWHEVAKNVLEDRIHFRVNDHWTQFARRGASALKRKPRMLVLHKLNDAHQVELDLMNDFHLGENLQWLEFYTCAGLAPSPSLLGSNLTRIILPGCYRVDDRTLAQIASRCPRLEHLDVRACELVSDRGLKMISKYCSQLQLINVGRTRGGEHITYKGIKHLARQTQVTTLGIAGCNIDDRAIWELALNRGPKLQRLSLNNCRLLTDASVPRVLGYMPNLTVLEIRGCRQITHMRPIALFKAYREKQGQPPLIEGCEVIERRLQVAIMRLQKETSQRILNDLSSWVNNETDEDQFVETSPRPTLTCIS